MNRFVKRTVWTHILYLYTFVFVCAKVLLLGNHNQPIVDRLYDLEIIINTYLLMCYYSLIKLYCTLNIGVLYHIAIFFILCFAYYLFYPSFWPYDCICIWVHACTNYLNSANYNICMYVKSWFNRLLSDNEFWFVIENCYNYKWLWAGWLLLLKLNHMKQNKHQLI